MAFVEAERRKPGHLAQLVIDSSHFRAFHWLVSVTWQTSIYTNQMNFLQEIFWHLMSQLFKWDFEFFTPAALRMIDHYEIRMVRAEHLFDCFIAVQIMNVVNIGEEVRLIHVPLESDLTSELRLQETKNWLFKCWSLLMMVVIQHNGAGDSNSNILKH